MTASLPSHYQSVNHAAAKRRRHVDRCEERARQSARTAPVITSGVRIRPRQKKDHQEMSTRAASQRARHSRGASEPQRVSRHPQLTPIRRAIIRCGLFDATGSMARYAGKLSNRLAPTAAVKLSRSSEMLPATRWSRSSRPWSLRKPTTANSTTTPTTSLYGTSDHRSPLLRRANSATRTIAPALAGHATSMPDTNAGPISRQTAAEPQNRTLSSTSGVGGTSYVRRRSRWNSAARRATVITIAVIAGRQLTERYDVFNWRN